MGLTIGSNGYNVAVITVGTKLVVGASTVVDTDLKKIETVKGFADSGIMRIVSKINMSGVDIDFDGTVMCNQCANGIEFSTITFYSDQVTGGDPIIIGGQLYEEDDKVKVHLTATVVS